MHLYISTVVLTVVSVKFKGYIMERISHFKEVLCVFRKTGFKRWLLFRIRLIKSVLTFIYIFDIIKIFRKAET